MQTHGAAGLDVRPLHGDGDAVEEDDDQHHVVKHLMCDDLIAHDPKPAKQREAGVKTCGHRGDGDKITPHAP